MPLYIEYHVSSEYITLYSKFCASGTSLKNVKKEEADFALSCMYLGVFVLPCDLTSRQYRYPMNRILEIGTHIGIPVTVGTSLRATYST